MVSGFIRMNQRFWAGFIVLAILITAIGFYFAEELRLDTDLSRLLPEHSESVKNMEVIQQKAGGSHDLRIVLEGGPLEKRIEAATELDKFLHSKPHFVRTVKFRTPKLFLEKFKYQLVPMKSLDAIDRKVNRERKKNEAFLDPLGLGSESDEQSQTDAQQPSAATEDSETEKKDLQNAKDLLRQLDEMSPYYQTKDGEFLAIRVIPEIENFSIEKNRELLNQFKAAVDEFNLSRFHPDMKYSVYGSIPDHISRYDSIARDVSFGGWGILLILIVVIVYFKSFWVLMLLVPPLVSGLLSGLGIVYYLEGTLNAITVFLILVVFGMGIEFGIHLWSRYIDERKTKSILPALTETWVSTGRATITSAVALFVGYTLMTFSSFQGFAQFGRVAMVLVSAVALNFFFLMPAWICFAEFLRGKKTWPSSFAHYLDGGHLRKKLHGHSFSKWMRTGSMVLAIIAIVLGVLYLKFDYTFDDAVVQKNRPASQSAMGRIFTERLKPSALAAFKSREDAAKFLDFYEQHKTEFPNIVMASGLSSFLPTDQSQRIRKLQEIADNIEFSWLKKLNDEVIEKALREIKTQAPQLKPIQFDDLPAEMRDPFIASDGTNDSLVYLYDKGGDTDGLKSMKFAADVDKLVKASGQTMTVAGQEIIFADIVSRVIDEGPWLVIGMLLLVFAICWLDFREWKHAVYTIAPVLFGFLLTGIVLVFSKTQINFYNMIAFASLGSMVVDNSIHLYHRYLENKAAGLPDPSKLATLSVSPTIVVCTITSILGYGGMVVANHTGIASLGFVAVSGLICCLISSIVFFPTWLSGKN